MVSGYTSNSAGWRKVLRSQGAQGATNAAAEQRAAVARSIAPVRTGHYRESIEVKPAPTQTAAESHVVAEASYSIYVEAQDNVLGRSISS